MVGRNASMRFFSSCSRTTCSWRDLVQIANQWGERCSIPTRALAFGLWRLRCEPPLVGLLELLVLPLDDRLRAQALEHLVVLLLALVGEHPLADLILRLLERHRLGRRRRFELQDLVAA